MKDSVEVEDYEAFVARGRKRFRFVIAGLLLAVLMLIYVPWFLVPGLIKPGVAQTLTMVGVILMFGAWRALTTKIATPSDAPEPTEASRNAQLGVLLGIAGGILALNALSGLSLFLLGKFESNGLIFSLGFVAAMGVVLVRSLVARGLRSS